MLYIKQKEGDIVGQKNFRFTEEDEANLEKIMKYYGCKETVAVRKALKREAGSLPEQRPGEVHFATLLKDVGGITGLMCSFVVPIQSHMKDDEALEFGTQFMSILITKPQSFELPLLIAEKLPTAELSRTVESYWLYDMASRMLGMINVNIEERIKKNNDDTHPPITVTLDDLLAAMALMFDTYSHAMSQYRDALWHSVGSYV